MGTLVDIRNATIAFRTPRGVLRAVDNVSLQVREGEVFSLVGESGCGKSTLAFALQNLIPAPGYFESGEIVFSGEDICKFKEERLRRLRGKDIAMVFQASMNSFNPVLRFQRQIDHVLEAHLDVWTDRAEAQSYMKELMKLVRLPDGVLRAYPHELSGGMKQRMAIAVSLLLKPRLLVLDEPTTALDVLNQRLVLDILRNLHRELNLTVVFVTHDLGVVADIADRVGVMYAGKLVDVGELDQIFYDQRRHPYVSALLGAAPSPFQVGERPRSIPGTVPDLTRPIAGCRFAPRCPVAQAICREVEPVLEGDSSGHEVSCHMMGLQSAVQ